jgi:hypothetical protein
LAISWKMGRFAGQRLLSGYRRLTPRVRAQVGRLVESIAGSK